jgi:hypothetical protein
MPTIADTVIEFYTKRRLAYRDESDARVALELYDYLAQRVESLEATYDSNPAKQWNESQSQHQETSHQILFQSIEYDFEFRRKVIELLTVLRLVPAAPETILTPQKSGTSDIPPDQSGSRATRSLAQLIRRFPKSAIGLSAAVSLGVLPFTVTQARHIAQTGQQTVANLSGNKQISEIGTDPGADGLQEADSYLRKSMASKDFNLMCGLMETPYLGVKCAETLKELVGKFSKDVVESFAACRPTVFDVAVVPGTTPERIGFVLECEDGRALNGDKPYSKWKYSGGRWLSSGSATQDEYDRRGSAF